MFAIVLLATMTAPASALSATVPFELFDNRMLVTVSLDGKGPFSMIVDTGSSSLVITPDVARRLGIAARPAGRAYGAGSGSSALASARVPSLALGPLRFRNVNADVIDLSPIRHRFGFPALDGVIGYETLRRFRVGINMDASLITLSSTTPAIPKTASAVAFAVDADGLIHIPAAVDGVHGTFLVDTGDRSSLTLFRRFAQANDFYRDAPVRNVVTGYGVGGPIYSDLLRTTVSLFGSTIPSVLTRASRDKGGAFATGPEDASVGMGLLKRFNLVFDYPDNKIFAWPSTLFAYADHRAPVAYGQTNLPPLARHALFGAAVAQDSNGVRASLVISGSPAADAGLLAGDTIRAIDGTPVESVAAFLAVVHDLPAGKRIDVDIVRNGAPLRLAAVLAAAPDESDAGVVTRYGEVVVDDSLRRTLVSMPQGLASPAPAVLLIGGIGCYSIDVAKNPQDAYLHLSHDLAHAGFVAMRVEKSGVGDSQGPPCRNVDFDAEVRGYTAALAALQHDPLVDPARVYLLGHSIGTIVAPSLALENRVAGVIVVEAVARDWPEYEIRNLRRQLELAGESSSAIDLALVEKAQCMQRLLFEYQSENEIERSIPSCRAHNGVYPVSVDYVREVARLNIVQAWAKLNVPVLAIYGDSDLETELADHQRIAAIVNAAHSGAATLTVMPAMSHRLGRAATATAAESDDERAALEQYDTDLSAAIVAWLRGRPRS